MQRWTLNSTEGEILYIGYSCDENEKPVNSLFDIFLTYVMGCSIMIGGTVGLILLCYGLMYIGLLK